MYSHPAIAANQYYASRAKLPQLALTAPLPRRISGYVNHLTARKYLFKVCKALEERLLDPISVTMHGTARLVRVFGVVGYRIDHERKVVIGGRITPNGRFTAMDGKVDIYHPMRKSLWMRWFIEDSGILDEWWNQKILTGPADGSFPPQDYYITKFMDWLSDKAFQILKATDVFSNIRKFDIPRALNLDPSILDLALRARIHTKGNCLNNDIYTLVWRNETDFRRVASENPKLLPLLTAYFLEMPNDICIDPVQSIKNRMRCNRITEAGWRYLAHHGTRIFRIPWAMSSNASMLMVATNYLRTLQTAELPPPPPASVVRTWLSPYIRRDRVDFKPDWCDIPPPVLGTLLQVADEYRTLPQLDEYCELFHELAEWSVDESVYPDSNQAHSGLLWLMKEYDQWKKEKIYTETYANISWDGVLTECEYLTYRVVPVVTAVDLYQEGVVMRNCLRKFVNSCAEGKYLVFSVREIETERHIAVIGVRLLDDGTRFIVDDVRGIANQIAKPIFWNIGEYIVQACSGPHEIAA